MASTLSSVSQSTSSPSPINVTANVVKPLIFLSIDRVLYKGGSDYPIVEKAQELFPDIMDYRDFKSIHYDTAATHFFNPRAVSNLEKLISATNACVVITSSWRENRTIPELIKIFAKHSFSQWIIDKTLFRAEIDKAEEKSSAEKVEGKSAAKGKAREIDYWLKNHPDIANYVILDELDSNLYDNLSATFPKRFVQIDPSELLSDVNVTAAIKILAETIPR